MTRKINNKAHHQFVYFKFGGAFFNFDMVTATLMRGE